MGAFLNVRVSNVLAFVFLVEGSILTEVCGFFRPGRVRNLFVHSAGWEMKSWGMPCGGCNVACRLRNTFIHGQKMCGSGKFPGASLPPPGKANNDRCQELSVSQRRSFSDMKRAITLSHIYTVHLWWLIIFGESMKVIRVISQITLKWSLKMASDQGRSGL